MVDAIIVKLMQAWSEVDAESRRPHVVNLLAEDMQHQMRLAYIDRLWQLLLPVRNRLSGDLTPENSQYFSLLQRQLLTLSDQQTVVAADVMPPLIREIEQRLSVRWTRLHLRVAAKSPHLLYMTLFFAIDGYPQEAAHSLLTGRWPMFAVVLVHTQTPEDLAAEASKMKKKKKQNTISTQDTTNSDRWITRISDEVSLDGCAPWVWPAVPRPLFLLGMAWCHDGPDVRRPANRPGTWVAEELTLFVSAPPN